MDKDSGNRSGTNPNKPAFFKYWRLVAYLFGVVIIVVGIFNDVIFQEPAPSAKWVGKKIPGLAVYKNAEDFIDLRKLVASKETPYAIVSLWATWCAPCKKELPAIFRKMDTLKNHGVTFILVNGDGPFPEKSLANAEAWLASRSLRFEHYYDFKDQFISGLNVSAIPFHVGLKKDGTIVWVEQGELEVDEAIAKF